MAIEAVDGRRAASVAGVRRCVPAARLERYPTGVAHCEERAVSRASSARDPRKSPVGAHGTLRRGKDVWDIGANVGIVSLLCARHGATRVVAFEPGEVNVARLEEHRQANPLVAARIEVIPAAVSDVDGEAELLAGDAGAEGQITGRGVQLWHDRHHGARAVTVKTIRLDSLLGESRPGLLKIDVEVEVLVLAGAHHLLRHSRPAIVLEVHNQGAYRACVDLLKAAGYAVREIVGRHLRDLNDEAISYGHLLAMPAEVEWPAERLRCLAF